MVREFTHGVKEEYGMKFSFEEVLVILGCGLFGMVVMMVVTYFLR